MHALSTILWIYLLCAGWAMEIPEDLQARFTEDLSMLGVRPDPSRLDRFQGTLTRDEFEDWLNRLYAPYADWPRWIEVSDTHVLFLFQKNKPHLRYLLQFADSPADPGPSSKTLEGLHLALDPGHIGGEYAEMEGRHFQIGGDPPVREGELVLEVARKIRSRLEALGARVSLVREANAPVQSVDPGLWDDLETAATAYLARQNPESDPGEPAYAEALERLRNLLFYRVREIRARAEHVNHELRPDLVLALHINAAPWPDADERRLAESNHGHVLINGAYMDSELELDDIRFSMLWRLLSGMHHEEMRVGKILAETMAEETGLSPFIYKGRNAVATGETDYLWGRNLLANRLYRCPVIFLEPWVANSEAVYPEIQEYLSGKAPEGASILDRYADFVIKGLQAAYPGVNEPKKEEAPQGPLQLHQFLPSGEASESGQRNAAAPTSADRIPD